MNRQMLANNQRMPTDLSIISLPPGYMETGEHPPTSGSQGRQLSRQTRRTQIPQLAQQQNQPRITNNPRTPNNNQSRIPTVSNNNNANNTAPSRIPTVPARIPQTNTRRT